jgi:hypothetical protein
VRLLYFIFEFHPIAHVVPAKAGRQCGQAVDRLSSIVVDILQSCIIQISIATECRTPLAYLNQEFEFQPARAIEKFSYTWGVCVRQAVISEVYVG